MFDKQQYERALSAAMHANIAQHMSGVEVHDALRVAADVLANPEVRTLILDNIDNILDQDNRALSEAEYAAWWQHIVDALGGIS
jgi:hypothetical protein